VQALAKHVLVPTRRGIEQFRHKFKQEVLNGPGLFGGPSRGSYSCFTGSAYKMGSWSGYLQIIFSQKKLLNAALAVYP
jgi:hypothetical protein